MATCGSGCRTAGITAFYGKFEENAAIDPSSPFSAGSQRVLRGGSWASHPSYCRSSARYAFPPTYRGDGIGFRVVLPVDAVKQRVSLEPGSVKRFQATNIWPADAPPPAIAPFDAAQAKAHQAAWAKYLGVPVEKDISLGQDKNGNDVTLTMVLIPPGEFMIGATDDEQAKWLSEAKAERPNAKADAFATIAMEDQRFVRITKPFWLSKLEFKTGQFRRFVESTGYRTDAETNGKGATRPAADMPFFARLPELNWDNWGKYQCRCRSGRECFLERRS